MKPGREGLSADLLVGRTLTSDVMHRLRNDIVDCLLRPGEHLRFAKLRQIYDASFGTLREALTSLTGEGLVIAEGQRGFKVAPVSRDNLLDLTRARVLIERETLKLSMQNGDQAWEDGVLAAFHRLDRFETRHGAEFATDPQWVRGHADFHAALASASGSPTLEMIRASLFALAHRYRRLSAIAHMGERKKADEHRSLMDAVLGRRTEALDLLEAHIRATADTVLRSAALD